MRIGWMLIRLAAIVLALLLAVSGEAWAERRVALVIGNGAYGHAPALRNPGNDADDVAAVLGGLGFEVESGRDLDLRAMEDSIRRFGRLATGADVALVFYAGHGLQVDGDNWLLPVDARLQDVRDLEFEAVNLTTILRQMEGSAARIVMLDACRDNPLAAQMAMAGTRSVGRGLARVEAADVGTLIAFATSPGATAADGTGRNSPFTAALLKHLGEPGLEIRHVMTRVRQSVRDGTGNSQTPWENASLTGQLYLAGLPPTPETAIPTPYGEAAPAAFDERQLDLAFWSAVQSSSKPEDFRAYLDNYPDGTFADLARNKLAALTPSTELAKDDDARPDEPEIAPDLPELARMLQVELRRLGCDPGTADGHWGPRSRRALEQFNREAEANFRVETPTAEALEAVRSSSEACRTVALQPHKPAAPAAKRTSAPAAKQTSAPAAKRTSAPVAQTRSDPRPPCTLETRRIYWGQRHRHNLLRCSIE